MRTSDIALAILPPALWAMAYTIAKPIMATFPPLFLMSIVYALTALSLFDRSEFGRPRSGRFLPLRRLERQCRAPSSSMVSFSARHHCDLDRPVTGPVCSPGRSSGHRQERLIFMPQRLTGIATSLAGVALVVGFPAEVGEVRGLLLIVMGAMCWVSRHHTRDREGRRCPSNVRDIRNCCATNAAAIAAYGNRAGTGR